jgi:hypothetical protein
MQQPRQQNGWIPLPRPQAHVRMSIGVVNCQSRLLMMHFNCFNVAVEETVASNHLANIDMLVVGRRSNSMSCTTAATTAPSSCHIAAAMKQMIDDLLSLKSLSLLSIDLITLISAYSTRCPYLVVIGGITWESQLGPKALHAKSKSVSQRVYALPLTHQEIHHDVHNCDQQVSSSSSSPSSSSRKWLEFPSLCMRPNRQSQYAAVVGTRSGRQRLIVINAFGIHSFALLAVLRAE